MFAKPSLVVLASRMVLAETSAERKRTVTP
jgi:hypothetical protein